MPRERLRNALKTIREELRTSRDFDQQTRTLLKELDQDIDSILENTPQARSSTLARDVESLTARFEADHPRLGQLLREVSDALSKLGL